MSLAPSSPARAWAEHRLRGCRAAPNIPRGDSLSSPPQPGTSVRRARFDHKTALWLAPGPPCFRVSPRTDHKVSRPTDSGLHDASDTLTMPQLPWRRTRILVGHHELKSLGCQEMSVIFSVALSVVALGFSMFVFVENRRRDRRDIFLKITEYLTSEDIQRGRYTLFEKVTDEASIEELSEHEYRDIHRTINAINILGLYVENGYISERDVIAVWAMLVYRAWRAAQPYVVHRTRTHGYNPWRYAGPLA